MQLEFWGRTSANFLQEEESNQKAGVWGQNVSGMRHDLVLSELRIEMARCSEKPIRAPSIFFMSDEGEKMHSEALTEDYDCASDNLHSYFLKCHGLMSRFRQVTLTWLPRERNGDANKLAQVASGYVPQTDDVSVEISQLSTAD